MAPNISRLRRWFLSSAIMIVVVVACVYLYGRLRRVAVERISKKLGAEVQQSTEGFSLSKSEAGRTLFTVRASKAVQYKQGGRAELRDVYIVVYGRDSDRFDQIYGADFEYDPQSGDVTAKGVVDIDLEANSQGPAHPDQAPPQELQNPVHLKTSGLTFNQKTGVAWTDQRIEFRLPQATGSAVGVRYDSNANTLVLQSAVHLVTTGENRADITGSHAALNKNPRHVVLDQARIERQNNIMQAARLTMFLREDNKVDRMVAAGDVRLHTKGPAGVLVQAQRGEIDLGEDDKLKTADFIGGVRIQAGGAHSMEGEAGRAHLEFTGNNDVAKAQASEHVRVLQRATPGGKGAQQDVQLSADAVDFFMKANNVLERAETSGAARIEITPVASSAGPASPSRPTGPTVITAAKFVAAFGEDNRMRSLHGAPQAKVVSQTPGQPEKVSTSRELDIAFDNAGSTSAVNQLGQVHYTEGKQREAWADKAQYSPTDETLILTGSQQSGPPRIIEGNMATTANTLRLNRVSGDALANGDVKTTYSETRPQPSGGLLASSDPTHVTARSMTAHRATGKALYSGDARLWQGANIIEAPTIEFDRDRRSVFAQAGAGEKVATSFVQTDKQGKTKPVNVTSARLIYLDLQRKARFEGGIVMRSPEGTVTAENADIYLQSKGQSTPVKTSAGSGQIERAIAQGHVQLQQGNRRANGEKLVYTGGEGKFVLSGGSPSIFDAEHGTVTGDSLTFFNRDDRLLVESKTSSGTVTQTRVSK
jgi:lipopolysaccharide export system protein LptA